MTKKRIGIIGKSPLQHVLEETRKGKVGEQETPPQPDSDWHRVANGFQREVFALQDDKKKLEQQRADLLREVAELKADKEEVSKQYEFLLDKKLPELQSEVDTLKAEKLQRNKDIPYVIDTLRDEIEQLKKDKEELTRKLWNLTNAEPTK